MGHDSLVVHLRIRLPVLELAVIVALRILRMARGERHLLRGPVRVTLLLLDDVGVRLHPRPGKTAVHYNVSGDLLLKEVRLLHLVPLLRHVAVEAVRVTRGFRVANARLLEVAR